MKKYKNTDKEYKVQLREVFPLLWHLITKKSKEAKPKQKIPIRILQFKDVEKMHNESVIRLGHSTLLFKFDNKYILTDPIFSNRASPVQWMGPKRFHKSPISIEDLPFIDCVIISHDHYDHLDKQSIKKLKNKVGIFYTTLGVGKRLEKFGVSSEKIVELNWWQSDIRNDIEFICTPTQHFSGRGLFDRDKTLWASWVIKSKKSSIYFGADGGYFEGFKDIAQKYGPFDMSFLEVGAYNELWRDIHMMPEESIQAHKDLRAKRFFPIHNGTFDLSLHAWYEPFERVDKLAKENNIAIFFPIMGEEILIHENKKTQKWWR